MFYITSIMLRTKRIQELEDEIKRIKEQDHSDTAQYIVKTFYGKKLITSELINTWNEQIISSDIMYISQDDEAYRPDISLIVLLETSNIYIYIHWKLTCKHSETECTVSICSDKTITPSDINFSGLSDKWKRIYRSDKIPNEINEFEKNLITIMLDNYIIEFCPFFDSYDSTEHESSLDESYDESFGGAELSTVDY